jgi:HAD superfamily hydrolase (TIGR01549 family)
MPNPSTSLRYDAVIFDVGGTLIGLQGAPFMREFLEGAGLPATEADARDLHHRLLSTIQARRNAAQGKGADEEALADWWRGVFAGVWPQRPDLADEMFRALREGRLDQNHDDAMPALEMLRGMGLQLGVVSNFARRLDGLLERQGMRGYFDFTIVSSVVGVAKPDPRIFDLAVARMNWPRDRLLYVGDHIGDDIEGAWSAGLDAVLIDRQGLFRDAGCPRIESLLELGTYVRNPE